MPVKSKKTTKRRTNKKSQKHLTLKTRDFKTPTVDIKLVNKENVSINKDTKLIKMFKTPFTPSKVKPQDDFYTWINYQWLTNQSTENSKHKKFYVQVDSFRVTQEKVYYELMDIVNKYTKHNSNPLSHALKNVHNSLINLNQNKAVNQVINAVEQVEQFIEGGNIYALLAAFNRNEMVSWGCPIVWNILPDQKNVQVYRNTISAPQLTAYDYLLYIEDESDDQNSEMVKYQKKYKRSFLAFIDEMFDACLGKNHGYLASDVWSVEFDMLTAMGCDKVKNDDNENYYNRVTTHDALAKYGFDWVQFSHLLGYKHTPEFFICTSLNSLQCMMALMNKNDNWKTKKWKTYFIYLHLRQIIRFHKQWRLIYYNFHGKIVKGQPVPFPDEIYPVFGMGYCFNTFLTNQYVSEHNNPVSIKYVHDMASGLLNVFKRIIKRNSWLSPSTRRQASLKLEHLKLVVGSPKLMRKDPVLKYSNTDAYENMLMMSAWRHKHFIDLHGKKPVDIPMIDWNEFKFVGTQAFVVNAYYTPTQNSIYVPLAYLQKPFIDLDERGIEYNLAYIGFTLGHEMSHSLDDMGSKYDHLGNLHNWWTPEDRTKFNRKVKDVIHQYETFAKYDNVIMDASLSTGENLADISGLAICMEYLRNFQDTNNDIIPIKSLSFNAFFVYIAIQSRQKIYAEAVQAQLKTNPHPMDKYRTNCPLARLLLFRSIYNIKKGDKMYWESTDTIW